MEEKMGTYVTHQNYFDFKENNYYFDFFERKLKNALQDMVGALVEWCLQ